MKQFLSFSEGLSLEELMGIKGGNNDVIEITCSTGAISCDEVAVKCEGHSTGVSMGKPETSTDKESCRDC